MRAPLLRLVRPGLAPTAAADVLAAAALAGSAGPLRVAGGVAASVCLYMGGMALNDVMDRERDRTLHPGRPLVVHPDLVAVARLLTLALLLAGATLGWLAGARLATLAVLAFVLAYNLGAKRYFPWDVLTLGGARAANFAIGLSLVSFKMDATGGTYLIAYFLYIAGVTLASRAEDREPPQTRRLALLLSFLPTLLALGALASLASLAGTVGRGAVFLVPLALLLFWLVRAMAAGTREATMQYVLRSLLAIFLVHALALWGAGHAIGLLPVVLCAAVSFFLMGALAPRQPATASEPGPGDP